jgi:tetratricopeptide (TPR) repeat protein
MTDHLDDNLLDDFFDGLLPDDEVARKDEHVRACIDCANRVRERQLLRSLTALPKIEEPPHDLWPAVRGAIEPFPARLKELILLRQVTQSFELINQNLPRLISLDPADENALRVLACFALGADLTFAHRYADRQTGVATLLRQTIQRFPGRPRAQLRVIDYAHLRTAEAVLAMNSEEYDRAITCLSFVLAAGEDLGDPELVTIATGMMAKALTRKGAYADAEKYVDQALEMAVELRRAELRGVLQMMKGWLLFQRNLSKQALALFKEAESVLKNTDDHLMVGNVSSAFARIYRRWGKYGESLQFCASAMEEYEKYDDQHGNVARLLVQMAFLKRLIAVRMESDTPAQTAVLSERRRERTYQAGQLRSEAAGHLRRAAGIYDAQNDYRGRGSVLLIESFLDLDAGKLEAAAAAAERAYALGNEKSDHIQMCRARVQQCRVETARYESGACDGTASAFHAEWARSHSEDAIELVAHTQNAHLKAKALIWRGRGLVNGYYWEPELAWTYCNEAEQLLDPSGRDHVWDELQALKNTIQSNSEKRFSGRAGGVSNDFACERQHFQGGGS